MKMNNANLGELYDNGQKPEGLTSMGVSERKVTELTGEEIQNLIKTVPGNTINGPLIEKMAILFNYNLDGTPKSGDSGSSGSSSSEGSEGDTGESRRVYTIPNIIAEIKYRLGKLF